MVLQHSHICFSVGQAVPYSDIKTAAEVQSLIDRIRATEPYSENRKEILARLNHLLDFLASEIVFACNANHTFPGHAPRYNYGYVFMEGYVCEIRADGSTARPSEFGLSLFDLTIYTPIDRAQWERVAQHSIAGDTNPYGADRYVPNPPKIERTETAEIIFEHGGRTYRSDDPKAAINAMLSVAAGKNSKSLAWSLAYKAVDQCAVYFPELVTDLKSALGNGRYPESVTI